MRFVFVRPKSDPNYICVGMLFKDGSIVYLDHEGARVEARELPVMEISTPAIAKVVSLQIGESSQYGLIWPNGEIRYRDSDGKDQVAHVDDDGITVGPF